MLKELKLEILKNPQQMEILLLKSSFYNFVKSCWDEVEQDEYIDGWYVKAICDYFQAVYEGKIKNLIVNVPPRTLKTLISGVMFPAWVWARNPKKKFIFASYAQTLAVDASKKCRRLIQSDWYYQRFPYVTLETQSEDYLTTSAGGHRVSVGVDGASTGRGCDYFIADDLLKASDGYSDTVRESTNLWYDETVSTRRNSLRTGVRIIICQRLHENDIVGHVISKGEKWEQLILPMEYEGIRFTSSIGFVDPRKEMGESLHPERFSKEDIEDLKLSLGSYATPGQLQQRPSMVSGNIYKQEWFPRIENNVDIIARWISADTAQSIRFTADPNAIVVAELTSNYQLFIRDVSNKRLEFTDLQAEIERLANLYKFRLEGIIIESKSSGISLQQSITKTSPEWMKNLVIPWNPVGDKITRFFQSAVWCEKGCVVLPTPNESNPWLFDFEKELFAVPNAPYDDMADALSQLIIYLENYLEEGLISRKGVKT